ncbi:MAG TPA: hypothetical protein VFT75_09220 [Nocardioidaceae bacterium]|jgi:mannose-6-phosphate isomerase-like protein (cupin superfamily)|nr:hypothetical protein [Nocardioidaceae bacterium]
MPGSLHVIAAEPDAVSPGGGAEIRHILTSPLGDLTHAVCPAGHVAPTHYLPDLDEAYFVLAGVGEIWRATEEREAVTTLRPGRWVQMPANSRFQFRAGRGTSLVFLVVVLPSWAPDLFHTVPDGRWTTGTHDQAPPTPEADLVDGWMSGDLPVEFDDLASEKIEVRRLGWFDRGSLAHCALPAGASSTPGCDSTAHQIWYVTEGCGELRRAGNGEETTDLLWPGIGFDIPADITFQLRATGMGPLGAVRLRMPHPASAA